MSTADLSSPLGIRFPSLPVHEGGGLDSPRGVQFPDDHLPFQDSPPDGSRGFALASKTSPEGGADLVSKVTFTGPAFGKQPQPTSTEGLARVGWAGPTELWETPMLTQGASVQQRTLKQTQKAPKGASGISL